ncbi:MAG: superinfection immunity protein [Alphaproteobacteria bacterium]|nr:superinfection immunity protein [Alphaproteobacteria bacterium]
MSFKNCPKCNRRISNTEKICSYCGEILDKKISLLTWFFIIFIVVVLTFGIISLEYDVPIFDGSIPVRGIGIIVLLIVLYFLPAIVAINKKHADAICVLNIFLGWTFVGWVGALVWAVADDKKY